MFEVEETKKTKNTIASDKFDAMAFNEMLERAEKLNQAVRQYTEKLKTIDGLASDIFNSLYKYRVRENPDEVIEPPYQANRPFVKKGMETKEYQQLRTLTRLQPFESALATHTILQTLMQEMDNDEELQQYMHNINQQHQIAQQLQQLQQQINGLNVAMSNTSDPNQQQQIQQKINALIQRQHQLQQQVKPVDTDPQRIRQVMNQAIRNANQNINEVHEFCTGWGIGAGNPQELPYEEKIKIAELLVNNHKFKKLAQIIGRFKRLAICKWTNKVKKEPSEVYDVTTGDDLTFMLPNEELLLAVPEAETLFHKKLVEKQLLQYDLEAKERVAKGDLIVCVDNSGSMAGDREIWSKAIAIGLLEIAVKEKRNFICIHFGDKNDPLEIIEIRKDDTPVDRLKKVIGLASYFLNGGTDFEKPLSEALKILDRPAYEKGDIVFITDGQCPISEGFQKKFLEAKKNKEFKVISVVIEGRSDTLEPISDKIIDNADIVSDGNDIAGEVFEFI